MARAPLALALSLFLFAVGCNGAPAKLDPVSGDDGAVYSDLAIAKDGTLHMVYVQKGNAGPQEVYHRSSKDKGETWSAPTQLTAIEPDPYGAGFVRVIIDGQGRVYAVWKDDTDTSDGPAGAIYEGTLVYRALSGGTWSDEVRISGVDMAFSWFPAVAPDGTAHVVWNEPFINSNGYATYSWEAGRVFQVSLDGGQRGTPRLVLESPRYDMGNGVVKYDGYEALRGYVDAQGRPHFVAVKMVAQSGSTDPREIILFDGVSERKLFDSFRFTGSYPHFHFSAPTLFVDASGKDHVLIADLRSDVAALLDFTVGSNEPVVVHRLGQPSPTAELRGFQVWPGQKGTVDVVLAMHDTENINDTFDAYTVRFDGQKWGAPVNVTQNDERDEFVTKETSGSSTVSTYSKFSAKYGAAARFEDGQLALALVNTEIQMIMRESTTGDGAYGSWSKTRVFFTRVR